MMPNHQELLNSEPKPRVHIKYEVETEQGLAVHELPFVVGVLGDFAGERILPTLSEREFIEINKDNFDATMAEISPLLSLTIPNTINPADADHSIQLQFNQLADFTPAHLVEQVPVLRNLKRARDELCEVLSKADCSRELTLLLERCLQDTTALGALSEYLQNRRSLTGDAHE
jgi:type VI secretion system protein ImpB